MMLIQLTSQSFFMVVVVVVVVVVVSLNYNVPKFFWQLDKVFWKLLRVTDYKKEYVDSQWPGITHFRNWNVYLPVICVCFGFSFCDFLLVYFLVLLLDQRCVIVQVSFSCDGWHIKLLLILTKWLLEVTWSLFYFLMLRCFL